MTDAMLARLEAHGIAVSRLAPEHQQVLAGLSQEELSLLLEIKARLDETEPEVQAHSEIAGGALF